AVVRHRLAPAHRAVRLQHTVEGSAGDPHLGEAVGVEVGDGGRAAVASAGHRRLPPDGAVGVGDDDEAGGDVDDLRNAVQVEVARGGGAVGGAVGPQGEAVPAVHRVAGHDLEPAVGVEV
ncbi:MAG: hypothetical protein ACK559_36930, partial [bacterium]